MILSLLSRRRNLTCLHRYHLSFRCSCRPLPCRLVHHGISFFSLCRRYDHLCRGAVVYSEYAAATHWKPLKHASVHRHILFRLGFARESFVNICIPHLYCRVSGTARKIQELAVRISRESHCCDCVKVALKRKYFEAAPLFHSTTVPSAEAVAKCSPFGEIAIACMICWCASLTISSAWSNVTHRRKFGFHFRTLKS